MIYLLQTKSNNLKIVFDTNESNVSFDLFASFATRLEFSITHQKCII